MASDARCEFDERPQIIIFVLLKVLLLDSTGVQRVQLVEFEWVVVRLAAPGIQTLII